MKKNFYIYLIVLICCTFTGQITAEKIADLNTISKPSYLAVDSNRVYIVQQAQVHVYLKNGLKKESMFGKKGEGPKEFMIGRSGRGIFVFPLKKKLFINSIGKISYFTFSGDFIKEFPTGTGSRAARFQPWGEGLISMALDIGNSKADFGFYLSKMDLDLKNKKPLYKLPFIQRGRLVFPVVRPEYRTYNENAILLDTKQDNIKVFSNDGTILEVFKLELGKTKVSEGYKQRIYRFFKTNPLTKDRYQMLKKMIRFNEFLPDIQNFWVDNDNGNIYIQTFIEERGGYEFYIFKITGEFVKRTHMNVDYIDPTRIAPAAVFNNQFYQLKEGEENWELHRTKF